MKSRICLIACDNGLGHVRRVYLIARELATRGHSIDVFAPAGKYRVISRLFGEHPGIENRDFATGTSIAGLRSGDRRTLEWHKRLPDLSAYRAVLSDNLPEVVAQRPDAVLSGHFLWHDSLPGVSRSYKDRSTALLADHAGDFVASDLFAAEIIRNHSAYRPVGLYGTDPVPSPPAQPGLLLVTGGTTEALRDSLVPVVQMLARRRPEGYSGVVVDPVLLERLGYNGSLPPGIESARYDEDMYRRVGAAVCRPGIGTITDLLQHGGRPYCAYEPNNEEVAGNSRALQRQGLGVDCGDPERALHAALEYGTNDAACRAHSVALRSVSFAGARETADIIENRIGETDAWSSN